MRGSSVSAVCSRVQVECRAAALLSCAHAPLARQLLPCYCPLNLTPRRSRHGASPVSRSDCGFAARTCTTRVLYLAVSASAMYCNTQYARRHHQADHMISRQHVSRSSIAMVWLSCTYQAASRLPRAPTCHPSTRTAAPTPCTPCTRASCRQRRNGMNCRRGWEQIFKGSGAFGHNYEFWVSPREIENVRYAADGTFCRSYTSGPASAGEI